MKKLTPRHVEGLKNALLSSDLSPGTVNKSLSILTQALNKAVSWELILRNPVGRVSRPIEANAKMHALSEAEAAKLATLVKGTRLEALYLVALKLGLRQAELLALPWSDVDLKAGYLTVSRSVDTNVQPPAVRIYTGRQGEDYKITHQCHESSEGAL